MCVCVCVCACVCVCVCVCACACKCGGGGKVFDECTIWCTETLIREIKKIAALLFDRSLKTRGVHE